MEEILTVIRSLKSEFSTRLDGIMNVVEEVRKEMVDCTERITQMEMHISTVEDKHAKLCQALQTLEKTNKTVEGKVVDMEMWARLNNVRLVKMPEGAESLDMCAFLEGWLPDALDLGPLRCLLQLERAQ